MSTGQTSNGGAPLATHSASAIPAPPAEAMPNALKPAPTKMPLVSGASPMIQLPSGVKLSGPLISCLTPAVPRAGTRPSASSMIGSKWSQSSGSSSNSNRAGRPRSAQGFGFGS